MREAVANVLEGFVTARARAHGANEFASELITACLMRVDWRELAKVELESARERLHG